MINISGLSPLLQAAVGGETNTIAGQYIQKTEEGFMYDSGQEKIPVQDPDNLLEMNEDGLVVDNDYIIEQTESGYVVKGVNVPEGADQEIPDMTAPDQMAPVSPGGMGGAMGGVGGPMGMKSPAKNYKKGYYGIK
tara:strand:- start:317 stop:721 length:405 start_codon:yes stop_codon:yes gene_type:complete